MNSEEFTNSIYQLSKRIDETHKNIFTEESTKMSFVVPLFQILGYNVLTIMSLFLNLRLMLE